MTFTFFFETKRPNQKTTHTMKTSVFGEILRGYPNQYSQFVLPDGGMIPIHAHITQVGRND